MILEPKLAVRFYKTLTGREPVRGWLWSLGKVLTKEIGSDIQAVQWRWPVSLPLVDSFGKGLYEVRTRFQGNIYRVLFCVQEGEMVLLHGFMKKTLKTPKDDLDLARKRQKEVKKS